MNPETCRGLKSGDSAEAYLRMSGQLEVSRLKLQRVPGY
jgi:hypothetical protein